MDCCQPHPGQIESRTNSSTGYRAGTARQPRNGNRPPEARVFLSSPAPPVRGERHADLVDRSRSSVTFGRMRGVQAGGCVAIPAANRSAAPWAIEKAWSSVMFFRRDHSHAMAFRICRVVFKPYIAWVLFVPIFQRRGKEGNGRHPCGGIAQNHNTPSANVGVYLPKCPKIRKKL